MDYNIKDVSGRLKNTREYLDISVGEMASKTNVSTEEYVSLENGEKDFSLSFLNQAANALGIELIGLHISILLIFLRIKRSNRCL